MPPPASPSLSTPDILPRTPTPWRWKCHKCSTWYILACTRRCLSCSHTFCQARQPAPTPVTSVPSRSSPRLRAQSRYKQNKRAKSCASEFDYGGWAAHNSWRRLVLLRRERKLGLRRHRTGPITEKVAIKGAKAKKKTSAEEEDQQKQGHKEERADLDTALMTWRLKKGQVWYPRIQSKQVAVWKKKEDLFLSGEHDCSIHCDWPNECGNTVYADREGDAEVFGFSKEEVVEDEKELSPPWSPADSVFPIYEDDEVTDA